MGSLLLVGRQAILSLTLINLQLLQMEMLDVYKGCFGLKAQDSCHSPSSKDHRGERFYADVSRVAQKMLWWSVVV